MEDVDWRTYAATKGLSEKQQKVADKIRKHEVRIQNLQRENEKIKVCVCVCVCVSQCAVVMCVAEEVKGGLVRCAVLHCSAHWGLLWLTWRLVWLVAGWGQCCLGRIVLA